jgi:protein phosphatase
MTQLTPLVAWQSQQGARGKENDDHYGWFTIERRDQPRPVYVALVADGVTSTEGGAQASRIAVDAVGAALAERPDSRETLSEWLANAILHANEEILFEAKRNPQWKGMSTTIVLAALAGEKLYVMNMGDSRAYLLRAGRLYQLTADHTWAQAAYEAGTITAAEAQRHPGRNQLQRYLGGQHTVNVARGLIAPGANHMEEYLLVQPGDALLLCTDGIYRRLPTDLIRQTMVDRPGDPQSVVDTLVATATANGEIDDITALAVEVPATEASATATGRAASAPFSLQENAASAPAFNRFTPLLLGIVLILALVTIYLLLNSS